MSATQGSDLRPKFWDLPLASLNEAEWEALCDRCGRCCLHKLQDEEDNQVYFTDVVCRLFDVKSGGCSDYANRREQIEDCLSIRNAGVDVYACLPLTCAYRLRHENQPLPSWHPLLAGDTRLMQVAGIRIGKQVVSEDQVDVSDLEERIIAWVEA